MGLGSPAGKPLANTLTVELPGTLIKDIIQAEMNNHIQSLAKHYAVQIIDSATPKSNDSAPQHWLLFPEIYALLTTRLRQWCADIYGRSASRMNS